VTLDCFTIGGHPVTLFRGSNAGQDADPEKLFEMAAKDIVNVVAVGRGSPATTVAMLTLSFSSISKTITVAATASTRDLHPGCWDNWRTGFPQRATIRSEVLKHLGTASDAYQE
jgi:hypothetical protein